MLPPLKRLLILRHLPPRKVVGARETPRATEKISAEHIEIVAPSPRRALATRAIETAWFAHADVVSAEPAEDASTAISDTTHADVIARAVRLSDDDYTRFSLDLSPQQVAAPPVPGLPLPTSMVALSQHAWARAANWVTAHPLRLGLASTLAAALYLWISLPSIGYTPRHANARPQANSSEQALALGTQSPHDVVQKTAQTYLAAADRKLAVKKRRALRRHIAKARKALKRRRYRSALRHARRALRIQPHSRVAMHLKARARRRL
ncbi:MAG: hypothetical protein JRH20_09820 [Deltaproteobacteria bacterium]|nr:hypothetical protein [Deltaproteobacteria bacterium]